jgi:predicted ATP-dependent serine protease
MTFGKPKQTSEQVRCLACGEQYRDYDINLKHSGRTEEGDYWNSECPECGRYDLMQEEYAEMSEEEFREEQHHFAQQQQKARKGGIR